MENELFDQRKWHEQHSTPDMTISSKDGCVLAVVYLSPQGRTRDELAQYVARLRSWADSLSG